MPSLVYQIFVDRFASARAQPAEPERAREEGLVRRAWHQAPEQPGRGRDLFGGDLDGVCARLDHVTARRAGAGRRRDCARRRGGEVAARAAAAARRAGAVDGVIGEVMAWPAGWTGAGALDGVMNYWLRSAALELASGQGRAQNIQAALDRLVAEMDPAGLAQSWS